MDSNLSVADIAAVTRGGNMDGFGDGNGWWIILILLFALGGNGFGYGRGNGDYITSPQFESANQFQALDRQLGGITYGIADSTFALNNSILTEGRALQTQLAQCCCDNKMMTLENRYLAAQNTADINANTTAQTQKILDKLCQNEIDTLRSKVSALELQAAVANTVKYPTTTAYCSGANPFAFNCGCNGNI